MDRNPPERDRRITRLVQDLDLVETSARAAAEAGIPERTQAVAYCLIVLADKDASPRRSERERPIEVDAPEAGERLAYWAAAVATNLRDSGKLYTTVQEEWDACEITTLRTRLLPYLRSGQHDVLETIADEISDILLSSPLIAAMSVDAARATPAAGKAYAFRTPLLWWIGKVAKSKRPPETRELKPGHREPGVEPARGDRALDDVLIEELAEEGTRREDALAALVRQIAALKATRGLLAEALDLADRWDRRLAATTTDDPDMTAELIRIRAAMLYEAGQLALERRSMTGMLAYVLLAMRAAPRLQHVALLSLRDAAIDGDVIDDISARMATLLDDPGHPSPLLVDRTRAAPWPPVPGSRAATLARLRDRSTRRARELAPVTELVRTLPPTVAGLAEIGRITDGSETAVTTYRRYASLELKAIDAAYARVFRRYTMGSRA